MQGNEGLHTYITLTMDKRLGFWGENQNGFDDKTFA